ncbi:hypothetical protein BCR44DRAFT_116489 [Catenaria anguillulae PL171]|uniref:Uncharacterized protein n=1 Tax=Catenaria anguillulae PL171 TaxID=765915 RepID=A0A1Y2HWZ6_9FUNG|nr:hypothetical protein BCR44DRAFT_116489 [Catenaria anguillulae PL171]
MSLHHPPSCPCTLHPSHPSLSQSLDELDFERSIHGAAASGDLNRTQRLLASSPTHLIHTRDTSGLLPIHYAARNGHAHLISLLADEFTLTERPTSGSGLPALHRAVLSGSVATVKAVLDACLTGELRSRVVKELVDGEGRSAVQLARQQASTGTSEIVELLSKWT